MGIISQTLVSHALEYINSDEKESLKDGYKEVIDELDKIIKSVESR